MLDFTFTWTSYADLGPRDVSVTIEARHFTEALGVFNDVVWAGELY